MRIAKRSPFPAALAAFVLGAVAVSAGSSTAMLTVGATVVRSCSVLATSPAEGSAQLDLTCATGAASSVRGAGGVPPRDSGNRLRLRMSTGPFRAATDRGDLEVVTVDF